MTRPEHCPVARTLATGERECGNCGRIWDEDEQPPTCDKRAVVGPDLPVSNRVLRYKPRYYRAKNNP